MDINLNPQPIKNESRLSKFLKPKFIFTVLGIIILIEAVIGIASIIKTQVPSVSNNTPASNSVPVVTDGSFTLSSAATKYKVGDKISVSVDVSTGGNPVVGADLILQFDPKVLSLSTDVITSGKVFPTYPLIDLDQKSGIVRISGISEGQSDFNGMGNFANLTFSAKAIGNTAISVTYKEADTKDSNLVSTKGVDVLKKIVNLSLEIN